MRIAIGSLDMHRRPSFLAIASTAAIFALSGCAAPPELPTSRQSVPAPTSSAASDSSPSFASLPSFEEHASLPPGSTVLWGDALFHHDEWDAVEDTPAREGLGYGYLNADQTCLAELRAGRLEDFGEMDDAQASELLITRAMGADLSEDGALVHDGYFLLGEDGQSTLAHRQFSVTINSTGYFIAARAFADLEYYVLIRVLCQGTDVQATAREVLGLNTVVIEPN